MTAAEAQAILTTIHTQIDGRSGSISSISIRSGTAKVVLEYATFAEVFAGQDVDQNGSTLKKVVGVVTYVADAPGASTFSVPA